MELSGRMRNEEVSGRMRKYQKGEGSIKKVEEVSGRMRKYQEE